MKHLFATLIVLLSLNVCLGQFEKNVTLRATGHFELLLNRYGMNEFGAGVGLDASFFSKGRLQLLAESSTNNFAGDKVLRIDSVTGKVAKTGAVFDLKLGPQYFVTRNIALAITYGPSWHVFQDFGYTLDYGLKYSVTGFWGRKRKFVTKAFFSDIPNDKERIRYLGLGAGIRF